MGNRSSVDLQVWYTYLSLGIRTINNCNNKKLWYKYFKIIINLNSKIALVITTLEQSCWYYFKFFKQTTTDRSWFSVWRRTWWSRQKRCGHPCRRSDAPGCWGCGCWCGNRPSSGPLAAQMRSRNLASLCCRCCISTETQQKYSWTWLLLNYIYKTRKI